MITWPVAFGLTLVVEAIVLVLLYRRERPLLRILATALVANAVTHPVVFLVLPRYFTDYGYYIVVAEVFAFVAEVPVLWVGLRPDPWYRAISASALANGASYGVGLAIYALQ